MFSLKYIQLQHNVVILVILYFNSNVTTLCYNYIISMYNRLHVFYVVNTVHKHYLITPI